MLGCPARAYNPDNPDGKINSAAKEVHMNAAIEIMKKKFDSGEREFEIVGTCPWCQEDIELYFDIQDDDETVYISAGGDCDCDRYDHVTIKEFVDALGSDGAFTEVFDVDAAKEIHLD